MVRRTAAQSLDTVSFLVPNTFTVSTRPLSISRLSREIERVTGLRLLAELPDAERRRMAQEKRRFAESAAEP